jgi:hypothetical protein
MGCFDEDHNEQEESGICVNFADLLCVVRSVFTTTHFNILQTTTNLIFYQYTCSLMIKGYIHREFKDPCIPWTFGVDKNGYELIIFQYFCSLQSLTIYARKTIISSIIQCLLKL